jgi:hypothetical protein
MLSFDLCPFEGAAPIMFGMPRAKAIEILGNPAVSGIGRDYWGRQNEINVGYGEDTTVNHVGFGPGEFELRIKNEVIWTPQSHVDPNAKLLTYDSNPLESLGFLVFANIGVTTGGYHDDDPNQYSITVFPKGAWDDLLLEATRPNLAKYRCP